MRDHIPWGWVVHKVDAMNPLELGHILPCSEMCNCMQSGTSNWFALYRRLAGESNNSA